MKKYLISFAVILFLLNSCSQEQAINPVNTRNIYIIKSFLVGKWQLTSSSGCFGGGDCIKDSIYLLFTDNSYYEYYKKDSLTHRDVFEIKFDKSQYYDDSKWYVIFKGIPDLVEDSSSSTGYRTIYEYYQEIIVLNDNIMVLSRNQIDGNYIKIH